MMDRLPAVKICGLTNLEDALIATEAGADYLGFIFYPPSKRGTTPEAARQIVDEIRRRGKPPLLVGVFVNETAERMAQVLDQCGLDLAQLSGDEAPANIGDPQSPLYGRSYKAIRPVSYEEAAAEAEWYVTEKQVPGQPSILIDTHHGRLYGGTGKKGDWRLAARLSAEIPGIMLAGGLTAENIAEAVRQVNPFAVDVASGVEARPGKKDPELVRAFIQNARTARAEVNPEVDG
jgi:phosphoribosylanthranilate isomerase